jgi:hypothetical protein
MKNKSMGTRIAQSLRKQFQQDSWYRCQYDGAGRCQGGQCESCSTYAGDRQAAEPFVESYYSVAASLKGLTPFHLAPHVPQMQLADRFMPTPESLYWERQMNKDAAVDRGAPLPAAAAELVGQGYSVDDAMTMTGFRAMADRPSSMRTLTPADTRSRMGLQPGKRKDLWAYYTDEDAEQRVLQGRPAYAPPAEPVQSAFRRQAAAAQARDPRAQPSTGTRGVSRMHVQTRPVTGLQHLSAHPFAGESDLMTIQNSRRLQPADVAKIAHDARLAPLRDPMAARAANRFK